MGTATPPARWHLRATHRSPEPRGRARDPPVLLSARRGSDGTTLVPSGPCDRARAAPPRETPRASRGAAARREVVGERIHDLTRAVRPELGGNLWTRERLRRIEGEQEPDPVRGLIAADPPMPVIIGNRRLDERNRRHPTLSIAPHTRKIRGHAAAPIVLVPPTSDSGGSPTPASARRRRRHCDPRGPDESDARAPAAGRVLRRHPETTRSRRGSSTSASGR